jgi:hypothetical protein
MWILFAMMLLTGVAHAQDVYVAGGMVYKIEESAVQDALVEADRQLEILNIRLERMEAEKVAITDRIEKINILKQAIEADLAGE